MMEDALKWIGGAAVTILIAVVTYMANTMQKMSTKQSDDVRALHARIDETHRDYVRRDDFREFKDDTKATLQRIEEKQDRVIAMVKPH